MGLPAFDIQGTTFEVKTVPSDPDAVTHRVYFVYCAGLVKIGVTSQLKKRMINLGCTTPFPSQAVLLIPGGRLTEQYLHFVFDEYRARGEWFYLGDRIRQTIRELAPDYCQKWLEEEEQSHLEWIADEANRLGLIPSRSDAAR